MEVNIYLVETQRYDKHVQTMKSTSFPVLLIGTNSNR